MMEFLYFPKDTSEYIPAFITLVIFMIGAVATMFIIYKKSKKDERIFDEQLDEDGNLKNNHTSKNDY
ncbi:MAG TPA: hypothetical protein VK135_00640 [Candidatus Dormibacteraeota bacterium]|nr:hypothetical protein [Candidatus Dormibacteraeota bacterium]